MLPPQCPAHPRTAPNTCGEDAEGDERLADHVTRVLGTELDATRKSFLGQTKCFRGTGSSSSAGGLPEERGGTDARRDQSTQLRCLAAQAEAEVARRVSCVPCGARRTSAPSQLREPGPACAVAKPLPPGPPAKTGPTPGLLSPSARVPRVPGQSGLCWTVGARLELSVDSATAQGALHCSES